MRSLLSTFLFVTHTGSIHPLLTKTCQGGAGLHKWVHRIVVKRIELATPVHPMIDPGLSLEETGQFPI